MKTVNEILTKKDIWDTLAELPQKLTPKEYQTFLEWWAGTKEIKEYQPLPDEWRAENLVKNLRKSERINNE
jgi:hypothetical protein